ncbi:MAG: hypothetical protein K0S04_3653 [Herbinix sp.]|jgi:hypothetical protein|nr:hypothetical protein [Herbinix sp.]
MYINSTNSSIYTPEYYTNVSPNWITSERYAYCEYFFNQMNASSKKEKHMMRGIFKKH